MSITILIQYIKSKYRPWQKNKNVYTERDSNMEREASVHEGHADK